MKNVSFPPLSEVHFVIEFINIYHMLQTFYCTTETTEEAAIAALSDIQELRTHEKVIIHSVKKIYIPLHLPSHELFTKG